MASAEGNCPCGRGATTGHCPFCGGEEAPFLYWCETCRQVVGEKRCPLCGLKARKVRDGKGRRG